MLCNYTFNYGMDAIKSNFLCCCILFFSYSCQPMQACIFFDGCYFSSSRPRQSFPMFSFQNQHILVYKHQFGCYSSGAAFFLSCEQIPSKCIRRVKLTPHQTYQHDFLTATFASDPVATAYIYQHNMQFNTKKSSSLAL